MSATRSQAQTLPPKARETSPVRSAYDGGHAGSTGSPENAAFSTPHHIRTASDPQYHTAFMQCRTCCNCHSQCSYYGKGRFDARGNYLGSAP